MKTAEAFPAAFRVPCPHCRTEIPGSWSGSYVWCRTDCQGVLACGWIKCPACEKTLKIPAALARFGQ